MPDLGDNCPSSELLIQTLTQSLLCHGLEIGCFLAQFSLNHPSTFVVHDSHFLPPLDFACMKLFFSALCNTAASSSDN